MTHSIGLDDGAVVTLAANFLDVSEYEIFRASYHSWYSEEGADTLIDRHFGDYMMHGEVPCWVRHFSRERLSEERRDESPRDNLTHTLGLVLSLYGPVGIGRNSHSSPHALAA